MKGQVLDYSVQKNEGVITTGEQRYVFAGSEWRDAEQPSKGMWVDFEDEDERAIGIYKALNTSVLSRPRDKSKAAVTFLAIFLGGFGAHKFYMGSWGWGLVYLLTCWLWLPFFVALIEWIRYISMTDEEFYVRTEAYYRDDPGPFSFFW